ncbi:24375_t:CDS:2 [Dentiscutata erythropus]|uniref:24375_t:CDS:1 n=1 Tax=Dentiscutata erythropus TaxID=1348616 RepID=A0A9N9HIX7_9GLOM|nr:24375_t:CDS:2 [Dentiscutata erythropus]
MLLRNENDNDDFNMGSNCYFFQKKAKAMISIKDEPNLSLSQIIEKIDGNHHLFITQVDEFDLTYLRFEKGFRINKDSSITSASVQAFNINFEKIRIEKRRLLREGIHECKHEITAECKRSLIFDAKFLAAYSEWLSAPIGLSHENSGQTLKQHMKYTKHLYERVIRGVINLDKNIIATKNFFEDVENVMNNTSHDNENDKLCEISEKYGHFYARSLILGGAIIKDEENTKISVENSKAKTANVQVGAGITNVFKSEVNYNKIQSLNDATKWKIIGYEEVYSLFELLDEELKERVLSMMGHQILEAIVDEILFEIKKYENTKKPYIHRMLITSHTQNLSEYNILASIVSEKNNVFSLHVDYMGGNKNRPVIVVHHIQGEKTMMSFKVKEVKIKLGWIIIGPPTGFDFSIQYPLIFKSGKYRPLETEDNHMINNHCMFSTCVLEPDTYNLINYDPKDSTFAIGNYLTRYQGYVRQEFIVDTTNSRLINDFFGEMKFNWIKGKNKDILYSREEIKISKNNLVLVNQIFDHNDYKDRQPGFVNIISDKICYGSLNSTQLNINESDGSIVYLSIPFV